MPITGGVCCTRKASTPFRSCSAGLGHQPDGWCCPDGTSEQDECTQHCHGICTEHDTGDVISAAFNFSKK